ERLLDVSQFLIEPLGFQLGLLELALGPAGLEGKRLFLGLEVCLLLAEPGRVARWEGGPHLGKHCLGGFLLSLEPVEPGQLLARLAQPGAGNVQRSSLLLQLTQVVRSGPRGREPVCWGSLRDSLPVCVGHGSVPVPALVCEPVDVLLGNLPLLLRVTVLISESCQLLV